jgi:colanic acid/amylovoran biosynthesis glycosyltransferase
MSPGQSKRTVAVYLRYYLPISMTFVYRQLLGVASRYRPIVFTSEQSNMEVFPFEPVFRRPRSLADRLETRMMRFAGSKHALLSAAHRRHWQRILVEQQAQVIHAHFGPYALEILPVARALGIPLVATFHGFDASTLLRKPAYVAQLKELFGYANIIAASQGKAERLLKVGADPARLTVHYIGVPVDTFEFTERTPLGRKVERGESVELLQVSNFVEVKGHRYTLEAFARLLGDYPHCRLTLAGDGPLRRDMETKARQLGIADRVRFTGSVVTEEVARLMWAADIFVHHSVTPPAGDQEAATTVIAEAMASGLVTVGTRHGGIPEMIDHGVDGYLVVERDVDGYVDILRQALAGTGEMNRRAADKIRSRFNLDHQNQQLMTLYDRAISGEPWN